MNIGFVLLSVLTLDSFSTRHHDPQWTPINHIDVAARRTGRASDTRPRVTILLQRRRQPGGIVPALPRRAKQLLCVAMAFFWILFGIDAIEALVAVYFFVIGLADGSVSSFNMELWLAMLGGIAAVLGGGWLLNARGHRRAACGVLLILALPGFLFAIFMLSVVIFQPRWN